jgi:hypothetical protein
MLGSWGFGQKGWAVPRWQRKMWAELDCSRECRQSAGLGLTAQQSVVVQRGFFLAVKASLVLLLSLTLVDSEKHCRCKPELLSFSLDLWK